MKYQVFVYAAFCVTLFISCNGRTEHSDGDTHTAPTILSHEDSSCREDRRLDSVPVSSAIADTQDRQSDVRCPMCNGIGVHEFLPGDIRTCANCLGTGLCSPESAQNVINLIKQLDALNTTQGGNSAEPSHVQYRETQQMRVCPGCDGKGYAYDSKEYGPRYTAERTEVWCNECHGYDERHYHKRPRCQVCNGRGKAIDPYH